jgi:hypothetical protein
MKHKKNSNDSNSDDSYVCGGYGGDVNNSTSDEKFQQI